MSQDKRSWEGVIVHLQVGDIITSKKGILSKTALLNRMMSSKRMKYLGNGAWERVDDGEVIESVNEVTEPS